MAEVGSAGGSDAEEVDGVCGTNGAEAARAEGVVGMGTLADEVAVKRVWGTVMDMGANGLS